MALTRKALERICISHFRCASGVQRTRDFDAKVENLIICQRMQFDGPSIIYPSNNPIFSVRRPYCTEAMTADQCGKTKERDDNNK